MWTNDWIGLPYAKQGRGPDAYDCPGLFLALQADRFGRVLPDPRCTMAEAVRQRTVDSYRPLFERVERPQDGDALLFRVGDRLLHVGFAVGPRHMLHIENEAGSVLECWDSTRWRARLAGSQPHQVVVEDDVKHPVQAVLDAPVGAHGAGEEGRVERQRRQEEAPCGGGLACSLDLRLDHGDGLDAGEARLTRCAALAVQPGHVVADPVAADLDPAMIGIHGLVDRQGLTLGAAEIKRDLPGEASLVVLEREKIIRAAREDRLGDLRPGSHGVDGDEGAGQSISQPNGIFGARDNATRSSCRRSRRSGIAVISFDFSSVACCPSTSR